jgi:hypothetical protein
MSESKLDTSEEDGPFITWLIRIGLALAVLFGVISTCSYREAESECRAACTRRDHPDYLYIPSTSHKGVVRAEKCYCGTEEEVRTNKLKDENRAF